MNTIKPILPTPLVQPSTQPVSAPSIPASPTITPKGNGYIVPTISNPGVAFEANNPKTAAALSASDIASSVSKYSHYLLV